MSYNTYLSLDIGSRHTRAWLFDNQRGSYRLRSNAIARTTLGEGKNLAQGVLLVLSDLQNKTGLRLVDDKQNILIGDIGEDVTLDGAGLSLSAGRPIRVTLIGVSDSFSLTSLRRLISLFNTEVVLEVNLQDDLNATAQLEKMISTDTELFVIAGGMNGGANNTVKAAIENIRLIYHNSPALIRPQVVYAGNAQLADYARSEIEAGEDFHLADNIQPAIGKEDLVVAWKAMLAAFSRVREQQFPELKDLQEILGTRAIPTIFSISRTVRLLDKINPKGKGVMALDVGGGSTDVVVSRDENLIAANFSTEVNPETVESARNFTSLPMESEAIAEYLYNKQLHPAFLPSTLEDLAVEHAWTRVRIQNALEATSSLFPELPYEQKSGLLLPYEPIILTGESLVRVPELHQSLLMALDGISPHGITTFVLDKGQVMTGVGSLMSLDPLLPVQVIDSNVFLNLGTVISVNAPENPGRKVLQIEVDRGTEAREHLQIVKSEIKRIEINSETKTRIYLSPSAQSDVGMGVTGLGGWVTVYPSEVGVVIDARGRPLELPEEDQPRSARIQEWIWELGG